VPLADGLVVPTGTADPVAEPLVDPMPDAEPDAEPVALGPLAQATTATAQVKGKIHVFMLAPSHFCLRMLNDMRYIVMSLQA